LWSTILVSHYFEVSTVSGAMKGQGFYVKGQQGKKGEQGQQEQFMNQYLRNKRPLAAPVPAPMDQFVDVTSLIYF
jgi:hypothetical protein